MSEQAWIIVGFIGQGLFSARFLVQWITSERAKRSVIPTAFWYFSVGGSLVLLCYSLHRVDPVFIVGQLTGLLIYLRNLYLLHRVEKTLALGPVRDDAQS
ncbi:MAG: lipid-A-disaccharide synthase N-terminal domain-containing protein [Gammaproteobacteria bacterium]